MDWLEYRLILKYENRLHSSLNKIILDVLRD